VRGRYDGTNAHVSQTAVHIIHAGMTTYQPELGNLLRSHVQAPDWAAHRGVLEVDGKRPPRARGQRASARGQTSRSGLAHGFKQDLQPLVGACERGGVDAPS